MGGWGRGLLRFSAYCWRRARRGKGLADSFTLVIEELSYGSVAITSDDLVAIVEVDIGEGVHPSLREYALGEDTPLTEFLRPVRATANDDSCRAYTGYEYDPVGTIHVDLPEVVSEVGIFTQYLHQIIYGARSLLEVYVPRDDG